MEQVNKDFLNKMEQGYKDFLINGTNDKTIMKLLEDDIVNDTGIYMFIANARERIEEHIEGFKDTVLKSNLATVKAWDVNTLSKEDLERAGDNNKQYSVGEALREAMSSSTDYVAGLNTNAIEVYGKFNNMPTAPSVKKSPLVIITKTSSLIEICNFKDLTFSIHSEARVSEFSNFKLIVEMISHIAKEVETNRVNKPNSLIRNRISKDNLIGRYIVERISCNDYYGILQVRFVSKGKRIVYNHYFNKERDHKQSLQLIDREYNLGIIRNNNFTLNAIYKHSRYTNNSNILFDTPESQESLNLAKISNRNIYLLSKVCNRNFKLITSFKSNLNSYLVQKQIAKCFSLGISSSLVLNSTMITSLKRKETENLITASMLAGVSLEVSLFNTEMTIENTIEEISVDRITNIAKLGIKNVPIDGKSLETYSSDVTRVFTEYVAKEKRNISVFKENYKRQQSLDIIKNLSNFLISARDTVNKSMFADMLWLNYQGPKNLEDKITILSALNSIAINDKVNTVNILGDENLFTENLFVYKETSRRESATIANTLVNSLNIQLKEFINNIKKNTIVKIDKKLEDVLETLNNLKPEELVAINDEYLAETDKKGK